MAQLLLVEDNDPNRKLLARRLKSRGYDVIEAADGQESIDQATVALPDLILMDMDLPKIDGWEATRRLKAAPATMHIPIMALTAHAMVGDRNRALEAGCDEYETKPVQLPRLLEKIEGFLNLSSSQSMPSPSHSSLSVSESKPTLQQAEDVQSTPIEASPDSAEIAPVEIAPVEKIPSPQTLNIDNLEASTMTSSNPHETSQIEEVASASPVSPQQIFASARRKASASPTTPQSNNSAGTILVVDDILNNRKLLIRRLGRKGYKVIAVDSGAAALEAIANDSSIDLILLDIMMPGMDGIETLERIRNTYSSHELPVIMATAKDASQDMVRAFGKGANDYITKPIDFPLAVARIEAQMTMLRAIKGVSTSEPQASQSSSALISKPVSEAKSSGQIATNAVANIRSHSNNLSAPPSQKPQDQGKSQSALTSVSNVDSSRMSLSLPQRFQCIEALSEDAFGVTAFIRDTEQSFIHKNCLLEEIRTSAIFKQSQQIEDLRKTLAQQRLTLKPVCGRGVTMRLIDVVEQDDNFYILHRMNTGESLQKKLLHQAEPSSIAETLKLMVSLLRAINPLHRSQFSHGYLRAQDFHHLENTEFLVLANSGLRQRLLWETVANDKQLSPLLQQVHVAPEVRQGKPNLASDLYSVGIIGLQALTGKPASELPVDSQGFVDWEALVPLSSVAGPVFQNLLSSSPQSRFPSTTKAINEIMVQWFKLSKMRAA